MKLACPRCHKEIFPRTNYYICHVCNRSWDTSHIYKMIPREVLFDSRYVWDIEKYNRTALYTSEEDRGTHVTKPILRAKVTSEIVLNNNVS